jgi:hypothetical protein
VDSQRGKRQLSTENSMLFIFLLLLLMLNTIIISSLRTSCSYTLALQMLISSLCLCASVVLFSSGLIAGLTNHRGEYCGEVFGINNSLPADNHKEHKSHKGRTKMAFPYHTEYTEVTRQLFTILPQMKKPGRNFPHKKLSNLMRGLCPNLFYLG